MEPASVDTALPPPIELLSLSTVAVPSCQKGLIVTLVKIIVITLAVILSILFLGQFLF